MRRPGSPRFPTGPSSIRSKDRALPRRPRAVPPPNVYRREPLNGGAISTVTTGAVGRQPGGTFPEADRDHCELKARCGSCLYVNGPYDAGLADKFDRGLAHFRAAELLGRCHVARPQPSPRRLGYRSHFKLAVRPATAGPGRFAMGLFAPGSHTIVDLPHCPLHVPALSRLITDLRRELEESSLEPYHEGLAEVDDSMAVGQQPTYLRYVAARAAHLTGEISLVFVVTAEAKAELRRLVQNLMRQGHRINSAHMNINGASGNAVFGAMTHQVAGGRRLRERIDGLDLEISPTAFFQINPWQAEVLYRRVADLAGTGAGAAALDLYCGTGQISLMLARQGYRVLGVEEHPDAVADAEANARRNHLEDRAAFVASRVEDLTPAELVRGSGHGPGLVVVNPSRRGLAPSTRQQLQDILSRQPGARLIYVSCSAETLARDLQSFKESQFVLRQLEAYDMFPQTEHMEWLAVLSKS